MVMVGKDPKRESHFPAIERRYGKKMSHWFKVMAPMKGETYPTQMAFLQENHAFSRIHANALIMYLRGSHSSQRYSNITDYLKSIDPTQAKTLRRIFKVIKRKYPTLEQVIAWNQPIFRIDTFYVLGFGVAKNHILINPFSKEVVDSVMNNYPTYKRNKHTIQVPNDWEIHEQLLLKLVRGRLSEK